MILNTWAISGIVAGVILLILVPAILWLRFGKKGKEMFGDPKNKKDRLIKIKKEIIENDKKIEVLINRLKKVDDVNSILRIKEEIKYLEKNQERNKRELKNLKKDVDFNNI